MSAKTASDKRLVVTAGRCVGCHNCELACAVAHSVSKDTVKAVAEEPKPKSRVTVVAVGQGAAPIQCRQCDEPLCVEVCPKKALVKEDSGPVTLDEELCIGCGFCVIVCPYGAVSVNADVKKAIKCDLCATRAEGPACVEACPVIAIEFE